MSKQRKFCDNCRGGNHTECESPVSLSTIVENNVKKTNYSCCDGALSWVEQEPV